MYATNVVYSLILNFSRVYLSAVKTLGCNVLYGKIDRDDLNCTRCASATIVCRGKWVGGYDRVRVSKCIVGILGLPEEHSRTVGLLEGPFSDRRTARMGSA